MEYSSHNVEYAVTVFYNGEHDERANAHTWLTNAQRVPEAWNFVWELLQPSKGGEVQFYAATTLHTKILRCWNEVPPESYDQLKEKLLQAVFTYSKGPKIVTNRLCISLAAFILQQGTIDLATILRPLWSEEHMSLLLEVLTVIPEEYNSMTMGSTLRAKNRAALREACPAVLDDMLRHLQSVYNDYSKEPPSEETMVVWSRAAGCASSWLSADGEDAQFGPALPELLPLCRTFLTAVHLMYTCHESVSDTALDVCEACLGGVRAAGGAGDASRYSAAALQLLTSLAALAAPIMQRDNVPNSANEDLLSAVITCCVALGETHSWTIVDAIESDDSTGGRAAGARQILELLLAAQAAPGHYPVHETRSNLVFGFWYTLQDEIPNVMERKGEMSGLWREMFTQLLNILVCKAEAPTDITLAKDDMELLRCYRQDIADTVMYCYAVVGESCWSVVEAAYGGAGGGERGEARREAALHAFLALADAAPPARTPPPLLALLHHAVAQAASAAPNSRTLATALHCLGGYACWVSGAGDAALGRECVRAAGSALERAPVPAALALRKLCADCAAPAAELAPDIVRAAQNSRGVETWTRRQLVAAAGAALAAAEPAAALPLLLELAATLRADLTEQAQEPTVATGAAECAAALITAFDSRPDLAAEVFVVLAPTLPSFAVQPMLVEPLFNVLKQAVSALMGDCLALADQIAELIVTGFNNHPCASGLDVVKLVLILAGNEWSGAQALLATTLTHCARTVAAEPSARSDLTEALFTLLFSVTRKRAHFLQSVEELLPQLIALACRCIRLWEVGAARSACTWLTMMAGSRPGDVFACAPLLTHTIVSCIGGATPRNQIEPLSELLLALNRASWKSAAEAAAGAGAGPGAGPGAGAGPGGELGAWLRQALAADGFPTPHATLEHKQKFIAAVIKETKNKRRLYESVQEFSLACRGLIGTEYAKQSIESRQLLS